MAEVTVKRPVRVIWKNRAWQIDPDGRVYNITTKGVLRRIKNPVICRDVVKAVMDSREEKKRQAQEEIQRRLRGQRIRRWALGTLLAVVVILVIWRLI